MNIADIFTKQLGPLLFRQCCNPLMGRVPLQYSAHYQELHLMTNPVRLGERESESEDRWIGDSRTNAAAAANMWVETWSSGAAHDAL